MVKTISRGIRLPKNLWDYIKSLNPSMSYSDIIRCALIQIYDIDPDEIEPIDFDDFDIRPKPVFDSDSESNLDDVHKRVDELDGYF